MCVFQTYNLVIEGPGLSQPIDIADELPDWLGDMILAAQDEEHPDDFQEAALGVLIAHATMLYADFVDNPAFTLTRDNVTLRSLEIQ